MRVIPKDRSGYVGADNQPPPRKDIVNKRWFHVNHAPGCTPEPEQKPICRQFSRCEGCPYPAHGFLCWRDNTDCMRTRMKKINETEDQNGTESSPEK